jgi:TRAP-type mannitol/chloroaromatic compound transport system permease small subunit
MQPILASIHTLAKEVMLVQVLRRVLSFIDELGERIAKLFSYSVLIVIGLETVEVIRRYVLHKPTHWSWEAAAILAGAGYLIGGAWVLRDGKHVRTDILYSRLSRKAQAIVDIVMFLVIFFVYVGVLSWKATTAAIHSVVINERTFTMWGPPLYPVKIVIALSFVLLALQGLAKLIRDLFFVIKGEEL